MNSIELYKKLPRTNCGACRQKACMPFSLAVLKGDATLTECPHLTQEQAEALSGSISISDWREKLILTLREEIKTIPVFDIAADLGAEVSNGKLVLNFLGRPFSVSADGEVTTHGHMTPWVKILILHYMRITYGNRDYLRALPKGDRDKWVSYAELKSGMVKSSSFHREGEEPLKDLFDLDMSATIRALTRLGAEPRTDFPTAHAWRLLLLPKVPIVLLYWPAEDEFPSKVKVLFNPSADRYLDAESIVFLIEGLVKNLDVILSLDKKGQPGS